MTRVRDLLGIGGLCLLFAGCASHGGVGGAEVAAGGPPASTAALTIDTPVGQICDDPRGRAVLDRNLPDLRKNPNYFLFKSMSLRDVASLSGGRISSEKLERVRLDLAAVSGAAPAPAGGH